MRAMNSPSSARFSSERQRQPPQRSAVRLSRRTLLLATGALVVPTASWAARAKSTLGALAILHVRQSTFLLALGQTRILIDPWFTGLPAPGLFAATGPPALQARRVGPIDLIVVTQGAVDRVDAESLKDLDRPQATCFVPDDETAALFRRCGYRRVRVVHGGQRERVRDGVVTFASAPDGLYGRPQVGAHFSIAGRTVLHTAAPPPLAVDDSMAQFARAHPAEVVLGCASGWNVGDREAFMSEEDAIVVATLARARYLFPHSTDVVPSALGTLLVSARTERPVQRTPNGPKLFRAPKGKWTAVARRR